MFVSLLVEVFSALIVKMTLLYAFMSITLLRQTFIRGEIILLSDLLTLGLVQVPFLFSVLLFSLPCNVFTFQAMKSLWNFFRFDNGSVTDHSEVMLRIFLSLIMINVLMSVLFVWWNSRHRSFHYFIPFFFFSGMFCVVILSSLRTYLFMTFFTWKTLCVVLYWSVLLTGSLVLLTRWASSAKSTTRLRKGFHLLAILLFLPIVYIDAELLMLSCAVVLSLMVMIEYARHVNLFGITPTLNAWLRPFTTHADKGPIIYSPMTLLFGCVLPLFTLGPPPSTVFSHFVATSGILVLGVTDAVVLLHFSVSLSLCISVLFSFSLFFSVFIFILMVFVGVCYS
jgi:hypothetical protein